MARRKAEVYATPVGPFVWACLNEPQQYKGKGSFSYSVRMALSGQEAEDLKEIVDAEHAKAHERANDFREYKKEKPIPASKLKLQDPPYAAEVDEDTDEPTGRTIFKFKKAADIIRNNKKIRVRVPLVDTVGNSINEEIWTGSRGLVAFNAQAWGNDKGEVGTMLVIQKVMITELSGPGAEEVDNSIFGQQQGFVAAPPSPEESLDEEPLGDDDSEDDDF